MTPALELDGVAAARNGDVVWSDGTFAVPPGAIVGVIGPNGSGKTTLLEMLLGLLAPATGTLAVLGETPHQGNPRIGYVPQNYTAAIGEAVRCRDLVGLGRNGTRWGLGVPSRDDRRRVDAALTAVSAEQFATRRISQLSGGQQQRVAIAQALVGDPELLLLDEPLANLDVRNQHEIVELLGALRTERDVTILVVVHDLNPLLSILNGAIYLLDGHAHYGAIGDVVDSELLTHLYETPIKVVRTAQGDLFTREHVSDMPNLLAEVGYQSNWFEILQANFMRNAFIGGTLVAIAAGAIGYFVVIRRDAFASHALAHIGFPGATFAVLAGIPVTLGLAIFCVGGGLAIGTLGKRVVNREVATGTILAVATGLGVLFASIASENTSTITSVLFGNLLAISLGQIRTFACFTVAVLLALAVIARPLLFASVDPQVAEAKGVPVRPLGVAFMVLLGLAVTMAVQVVGTLLLFALVVTPAAAALAITARPAAVVALGTGIALASVWLGLVVAVMFNLPPSFCIVTLAFATWLVTLLVTRDGRRMSGGRSHGHDHHHPEPVNLTA